jgi:hypothetical protein
MCVQAGGFIRRDRVCGDLDMGRALGDMEYKANRQLPPADQIISPYPDVRSLAVGGEDLFLVSGLLQPAAAAFATGPARGCTAWLGWKGGGAECAA